MKKECNERINQSMNERRKRGRDGEGGNE